jgi:hypothetical protein
LSNSGKAKNDNEISPSHPITAQLDRFVRERSVSAHHDPGETTCRGH